MPVHLRIYHIILLHIIYFPTDNNDFHRVLTPPGHETICIEGRF